MPQPQLRINETQLIMTLVEKDVPEQLTSLIALCVRFTWYKLDLHETEIRELFGDSLFRTMLDYTTTK